MGAKPAIRWQRIGGVAPARARPERTWAPSAASLSASPLRLQARERSAATQGAADRGNISRASLVGRRPGPEAALARSAGDGRPDTSGWHSRLSGIGGREVELLVGRSVVGATIGGSLVCWCLWVLEQRKVTGNARIVGLNRGRRCGGAMLPTSALRQPPSATQVAHPTLPLCAPLECC